MFGYALTTGDFNHDGGTDLAAGAPDEDVGAVVDAGAVSVLNGLTTAGQFLTQDSPGVGSSAEPGDSFGAALAAANPAPASTAATTTTNATAVAPPTPGSSVLRRH